MTLDSITRGNFRINRTNKNLDRPRTENSHRSLSSCVSIGLPGSGNNASGMIFQARNPRDLWGVKR